MKWTSQPSQRDQEIYQAVAISLRPQREVAELFGVSQGRVSQICSKLRDWLAVQIHGSTSLAEDHFIAAHELRLRLEDRMRTAADVFAQTCQQDVTEKFRRTSRADKPDVTVEEEIKRSGRPSHQMFREMARLDERHYQARLRESQFKAELVAGERQSRWWRAEALVQRCLGLCRQVVMTYGLAAEAGVTLSPLPQFEMTSLLASLRQNVSEGELGEDLATYLPEEWGVVARELGLVEEEAVEPMSAEVAVETGDSASEVIDSGDLSNIANTANTSPVVVDMHPIDKSVKVVNRANKSTQHARLDAAGRFGIRPGAGQSPSRSVLHSTGSCASARSNDITAESDVRPNDGETSAAAVPGHPSERDEYRPELLAA